jgi:hypothetical protein
VLTQCSRLTRNKQFELVPLEAVAELSTQTAGPPELFEHKATQQQVMHAIQGLPEHERMVTSLYYIGDYSTPEIAAFLEVPLTTVKKRLFDARKHLRERMTQMDQIVRDAFKDKRPSRDETFADTVRVFNEALESFEARIKQDRYIVAAILFGSLAHDTVWRKSDIDIMLVGRDGDLGPGAKGKEAREFSLVEHGVNIHATLFPRSRFKQMVEGSLQGTIGHSSFALSTLLFTHDETIRAYYDNVRSMGAHDQQMRLMVEGGTAIYLLAKAEKWLITRKDVAYSFVWLTMCVRVLADIELLLHGQLTTRESLPQALKLNPTFFKAVYFDLLDQKKDEVVMQAALNRVNAYLDQHLRTLFAPILDYLKQEGGTLTTSQLESYFRKQTQTWTMSGVYEWLADKGVIQKVPMPLRLTPKSLVTVDEAAYYYEAES